MKKIILGLFILLWIPSRINALSCTDSQVNRLEKLAKQIQTTYDYQETSDGVYFTIKFHNVHEDLYLVDYNTFENMIIYDNNSSGIVLAPNYAPGSSYTFSVLNQKSLCDVMVVSKVTVTLPSYNKYYKDPLCEGLSSYSLCQKWVNVGNISYAEFQKNIQTYREQIQTTDPEVETEIEDTFWNRVRNFMANYYLYFILVFVVLASIIVFLIQRRKKEKW